MSAGKNRVDLSTFISDNFLPWDKNPETDKPKH